MEVTVGEGDETEEPLTRAEEAFAVGAETPSLIELVEQQTMSSKSNAAPMALLAGFVLALFLLLGLLPPDQAATLQTFVGLLFAR